jgi:hypothetical protein
VRAAAASSGYHLTASGRFDLHGSGTASYLLVLRDDRNIRREGFSSSRSDELRIYDADDHQQLNLKFRFRPRRFGDRPMFFRLDSISDLDENGRPEIIGAWEELGMAPLWPRPVVLRVQADEVECLGEGEVACLPCGELGMEHPAALDRPPESCSW